MFDELFEGAHRRALGLQGRELIAMFEQEFELELSVGGIVLGMAGCEGFTVSCEREGIDGKEHEEVVLSQRIDDGAFIEFETEGNGLSLEARRKVLTHSSMASGVWTRTLNSRVSEPAACRQTSCLASAQSMPTNAANASVGRRVMSHLLKGKRESEEGTCELRSATA